MSIAFHMKTRPIITLSSLFCSLLLSLTTSASPATQPKDFEAVYKAKFRGIPITATRKLETLADGSRLFTFHADSWIASLKETSQFRWNDSGHIVPVQYHYQRTGLGRDREAVLDFDWQAKRVVNNVEHKPWKMDIPEHALDKLSYQLQIRTDLINSKPLLEYSIADGGRLKQYNFEILGEEEITTPAGRFMAIKVKRLREQDAERHTIFWMAKDWDYLVVRLQQKEDDGGNYEIDLDNATIDGKAIKGY
jgi:hypothetical protein